MSFNYGCNEEDISRPDDNIKVWPIEGTKVALVDADAIAYVIGYTSDLQEYLKAKRSNNLFDSTVFKNKCNQANFILNKWIEDAGCDAAKLYLTDGKSNFRLKIGKVKPYKGQRLEEKPPFFYEIRDWLLKFHGAIMSQGCEADDEISIEAWKRHLAFDGELWSTWHKKLSDFVIVSGDKDLAIIPGWRCPPGGELEWVDPLGSLIPIYKQRDIAAFEYWPLFKGKPVDLMKCSVFGNYKGKFVQRFKNELKCPIDKWEMKYIWFLRNTRQDVFSRGKNKGKGKFKRVQVGTKKSEYLYKLKGTGLKFFYAQLLKGDPVDNYPGLPGIGDVKAYEILDGDNSEDELVSHVRQLYVDYYGDKADDMLREQGQLAWMQTYRGELWDIPSAGSTSFPG